MLNSKYIKGYEGLYSIDINGNVTRHYKKAPSKILKPTLNKHTGYVYVSLCKKGSVVTHYIHRLLAETFIPNENNYNEVNHIDYNRSNNELSNLEWCDHFGNMRHSAKNISDGMYKYWKIRKGVI